MRSIFASSKKKTVPAQIVFDDIPTVDDFIKQSWSVESLYKLEPNKFKYYMTCLLVLAADKLSFVNIVPLLIALLVHHESAKKSPDFQRILCSIKLLNLLRSQYNFEKSEIRVFELWSAVDEANNYDQTQAEVIIQVEENMSSFVALALTELLGELKCLKQKKALEFFSTSEQNKSLVNLIILISDFFARENTGHLSDLKMVLRSIHEMAVIHAQNDIIILDGMFLQEVCAYYQSKESPADINAEKNYFHIKEYVNTNLKKLNSESLINESYSHNKKTEFSSVNDIRDNYLKNKVQYILSHPMESIFEKNISSSEKKPSSAKQLLVFSRLCFMNEKLIKKKKVDSDRHELNFKSEI